MEGWGVDEDMAEALRWFMPSAENGYALSEYKIGLIYQRGDRKVEKDLRKAANWLARAANHGFARAQNDLGLAYENRFGVKRDYEAAARWYEKAAEQGWAMAQLNIGRLYENGRGVDKDYVEAFYWYRLATGARIEDLRARALDNVARVRHRIEAREIASIDERIDNWRSVSQEESAASLEVAAAAPKPAVETAAVDDAYEPPPLDESELEYVPPPVEEETEVALAAPAESDADVDVGYVPPAEEVDAGYVPPEPVVDEE